MPVAPGRSPIAPPALVPSLKARTAAGPRTLAGALSLLCAVLAVPVAAPAQDTAAPALAPAPVADTAACHGTDPCPVEGGQYYVRTPSGWDGASPLPVVVWFHGWQDTGLRQVRDGGTAEPWLDAGWLFVAGDGAEKTWAHQGSPSQARDDIAYVRAVVADVAARYPLDRTRVLAAGFSQGGSMVWDVACRLGAPFTHHAPVAGAFWEPAPTDCPAGPAALRHVHGTADTVVPLEGRPIGDRWHQADVFEGLALWRATNGCSETPERTWQTADGLTCQAWTDCTGAQPLSLCLHDGGHTVPNGWVDRTLDWVMETAG